MKKSLSQRRRTASKRLHSTLYAFTGALWLFLSAFAPMVHAEAKEQLVARKPFVSTVINDAAVTKNKAGTPLLVSMPQGINTPLQIVDLKTYKGVHVQELRSDSKENAGQAFVTLPNRHVLVGTDLGYVYDVDPDKLTATEQEAPEKPEPALKQAVLGAGSTVYFGGEMGGATHVYAYDSTKTTWREVTTTAGPVAGMAYAESGLYLGDAIAPTLWQVQANGSKTQRVPQGLPAGTTGLSVAGASGGFLYINTLGAQQQTFVLNLADFTLHDTQTSFGRVVAAPVKAPSPAVVPAPAATTQGTGQNSNDTNATDTTEGTNTDTDGTGTTDTTDESTADTPNTAEEKKTTTPTNQTSGPAAQLPAPVEVVPAPVYFGSLKKYEPTSKSLGAITAQTNLHPAYGNCWIDSNRCVVIGQRGELGIVTVNSRRYQPISPSPLVGGYHAAGTIQIDEQNVMYAAGAGTGSTVLRVERDKSLQSKMVSAGAATVSAVMPVGGQIVAGTTKGGLAVYDPSAAAKIPRFSAGATVGDGSIDVLAPVSDVQVAAALNVRATKASGALAVYDVANKTTAIQPQLILQDQTITSLAYGKGVIYGGGTSSTQGAQLFAYDLATKTVKTTIVPVQNAQSITSLVMLQGYLYGVADSIVFQVDTATFSVVAKKPFYATSDGGNLAVRGGKLVASVGGKIYELNPTDLTSTYVANGSNVAVDALGDYYYTREGGIYRILTAQEVKVVSGLQPSSSDLGFSGIDWKIGLSGLAVFLAIVAITILKIHTHRKPTYSLRR